MKKVLIPTAVFASLAIVSATAFAAVNSTGNMNQPVTPVVSVAANTGSSVGTVEYAKKTLYNPDGSLAAVDETWADPATHNQRSNYKEAVKGTDSLKSVAGTYILDNANRFLKVSTNDEGSLVGFELKATTAEQNQNWSSLLVAEKEDYINEYKEGTRSEGWTDAGSVKAADGQPLRKLTRTDKSETFNRTFTENVLLNENGLPVQGEIYEIVNNKTSLLYSYDFTFQDVPYEDSLFDVSGIQIQAMK